jgi:hypothetical protein
MTSQTHHRVDLAREQLEMALVAFVQRHRFTSAISVASAGRTCTGRGAAERRQPAGVDWKFDAADLAHTKLRGRPLDRTTFNDANTCVANALRHFEKDDASDFEADLEEAACWMLVRVCENAHRLGLTVQGFDAFNERFCEHVVGV